MNNIEMKKILLTIVTFLIVGVVNAQQQNIKIPQTKMSTVDVFDLIRQQANLGVIYSSGLLDPNRMVIFPKSTLTVDEAIKTVTKDIDVAHSYEGHMIILVRKPKAPKATVPYTAKGYTPSKLSDFDTPSEQRPVREKTLPQSVEPEPQVAKEAPVPAPLPVSKWRDASEYTSGMGALPHLAIKTNLLYGIGTLTPNLSAEIGLGRKATLEVAAGYNPWNLSGSEESNRKLAHMIIKPEFRYWLCERFNGHFFGVHAIYSRYNIGSYDIPTLFEKEYRYEGQALGGGITYGYNLPLSKRWGVEFAVGVGALWLDYDRFDCAVCNRDSKPGSKTYLGPTNASISLVYLIK